MELPVIRTEFGFARTSCDCPMCRVPCKLLPGYLIPADLERMLPKDPDEQMDWAKKHLRASPGFVLGTKDPKVTARMGTLVPRRNGDVEVWETTNERTVKWDKEQTKHLRERLSQLPEIDKAILEGLNPNADHCHWFVDNKCMVHAVSPFGCAFFSEHQNMAEFEKRQQAGMKAIMDDWMAEGPYSCLWNTLAEDGLRGPEIKKFRTIYNLTIRKLKEQEARKERRKRR